MDQLTDALRAVVERFGEEVLFDPDRLRSLLMDELGSRGVALPDEVGSLTRLIDPSLVSTLRDEPPSAAVITQKAQSEQLSEAEVTDLLTTLRSALSESAPEASDTAASTGSQQPRAPVSPDTTPRRRLPWVAVVAIAVGAAAAVGVALTRSDDQPEPTGTVATTTTTEETTTTTEPILPTTLPSNAPAEVSVLVANASGIAGAAGATQETLNAAGYTTTRTANAPSVVPSTQVLFVEGSQGDAQAVATALELDATVVQPMPEPVPLALEGATVLVLVGPDLS